MVDVPPRFHTIELPQVTGIKSTFRCLHPCCVAPLMFPKALLVIDGALRAMIQYTNAFLEEMHEYVGPVGKDSTCAACIL